jgi:hypothetical protein
MRKALLVLCLVVAGPIFLILGLTPGESVIASDGADSFILKGIARFAVLLTGLCEFILGAAFVAMWITIRNKLKRNP